MHKWRRFFGLSRQDRRALLEAWLLTGVARLVLWLVPFRRVARWLGTATQPALDGHDQCAAPDVHRVKWAVAAASRRTPWKAACLVQAIVARLMLGRRGVSGTIYLGVANNEFGKLVAHAWLSSGSVVVTGQCGMDEYTTIGTFFFQSSGKNQHELDRRHTPSRRQTC